jgi:hypothetical protein
MKKQWKQALTLMVVLSLCATGLAKPPKRAGEVTAKSEPNKPRVVASISLVSINAAKAFMAEVGQPLDDQTINGLTSMIPIGAQVKLAFDKPIGVLLVVGKDVPEDKMAVITIPVAKGQGLMKQLLESGAKKVKGHDDTVTLEDMLIRRTENFLLINGTIETITSVNEGDIMRPYSGNAKGVLVSLDMDVDALRKAYPEQTKMLVTQSLAQMNGQLTGKESQKMAQFWSEALGQKIQRVQLRVDHADKHLSFAASIEGYTPWEMVSLPRPKLNGKVLTQIDMVYAKNSNLSWLDYLMALGQESNGAPLDDETAKEGMEALKLMFGGDALSFFVTQLDKKMVAGMVQQHASNEVAEKNVEKIIKLLEKAAAKSEKKGEKKEQLTRSKYVAKSGEKVTRLTIKSETQTVIMDFANAGEGRTLVTFALDEKSADVSELLPLKVDGKMTTGLNATMDIGSLAKATMELAASLGQGEAIDEETAQMIKRLSNHPLKFQMGFKQGAFEFSFALPMSLIKQAGEAAGIVGAGSGPADPLPTNN